MNILYYCWQENSCLDIMQTFKAMDISYHKIDIPFTNYDTDDTFTAAFEQELAADTYDSIFTFNYFPLIAKIAEKHQIPYLAWIYDCPHLTLYSATIKSPFNYLFLFDQDMCKTVTDLGGVHVFHLPLAVNTRRLNTALGTDFTAISYEHEVSFVGSLYEQNLYDQINYLPDYTRGFLTAILNSQQKVWGFNFANELITDSMTEELDKYLKLEDHPEYNFPHKVAYANMLNQKITSLERIAHLNKAARYFAVDLYTGSDTSLCPGCTAHGFISYTDTMPQIFRTSKINLNFSLRSITSGIPLRCMDIMGAGGFLLTNYQPELCEYFEAGRDFVYFEDPDDMVEKISYYLQNEEERIAIAQNGWKRIQEDFSYNKKLQELMDLTSVKS